MRFHNTLAVTVALALAAATYAQTVPGQNPATKSNGPPPLQVNTPPVSSFVGNRGNGPGTPLQVNTPPVALFLGNGGNGPGTGPNQQPNPSLTIGARDNFNSDQLRRHAQFALPYGSFRALESPDVQRQLNLTDQQRQNLGQEFDWIRQQLQDIGQFAATDPTRAEQAFRDYRRDHQQRFNQLLTPDQQRRWQQVTGEPFTVAPPFMVTVPSGR